MDNFLSGGGSPVTDILDKVPYDAATAVSHSYEPASAGNVSLMNLTSLEVVLLDFPLSYDDSVPTLAVGNPARK